MNPNPLPTSLQLRRLNNRYQLVVDSVDTFKRIPDLDPIHWSANSAPIDGLSCNQQFLAYLDTDNNQRILPAEVITGCEWLIDSMKSLDGVITQSEKIALDNFRQDTSLGQQLKDIAKLILHNLGKETDYICLDDVQARAGILKLGATNGDGVLPPSVLTGAEQQFVVDCLTLFDGISDISGEKGIDASILNELNQKVTQWFSWQEQCPVSKFTPNINAILHQISPLLDQHFTWVHKPQTEHLTNHLTNQPHSILLKNQWVHPEHREIWHSLWSIVLEPLEIIELSWTIWEQLWWDAQAYKRWYTKRPIGNFTALSDQRLLEMQQSNTIQEALRQQLQLDQSVSKHLEQLSLLEKTLLFQEHLCPFINSFVNFSTFYNPATRSMPEIGSLLLDGRWFRLVVHVPNKEKHLQQAQNSGFFLLYLTVQHSNGPFDIAVAVTGAERGDLHIGKKGVFYDTHFTQFPAEVTNIVDNPINIKEALLKPLEKLQTLAKQRLEKFSKDKEQELESGINSNSEKTNWMNGGVTLAALSSSFAYLVKTLTSVKITSILLVILTPLTILALFSSLVAGWKLHKRDLGPILEASGWGINHPLRVPDWASEVFTLGALVPKPNRSANKDMLLVFEHTANPYGTIKRISLGLLTIALLSLLWWRWDLMSELLQNWDSLKTMPSTK